MDQYSPSKALYQVDRIKQLQQNKPIAPTLLQVDLEAYCGDNCNFCSYRKEEGYNDNMLILIQAEKDDRNQFKPIGKPSHESGLSKGYAVKIPRMMKEAGIPAIELTGGGEPTIWHAFDLLLDNLIREGIEIGLVTNGSNLSDSRIEALAKGALWIRFSMDSSNAQVHKIIHRTPNTDFDRRINNIRKLVQKKRELNSNLTIGISFIINPENLLDILDSVQFYKKLGVDNIRYSWMYDRSGNAGLTEAQVESCKRMLKNIKTLWETETYKILFEEGRIDLYSKPNIDFDCCYMQRFVWALGANYLVYPCCIVKYMPNMEVGDIRVNTLKEIIESSHEKMNGLDVKKCPPCWLRQRNKVMAQAIEKPKHENFI